MAAQPHDCPQMVPGSRPLPSRSRPSYTWRLMALLNHFLMKGDCVMYHLLNRPEQTARERLVASWTLTPLGRTTALALLGIALTYVFLVVTIWWTSGTVVLPVLAFVVVALVAAASVAAGVR